MNNRATHGRLRRITNAVRLDAIDARLGVIERTLLFLIRQGAFEMATLNEIVAAVEADTAVDESAITLLEQISQMLKDAQASNDPAAMQAVVDMLDRSKQRMADAILKNTPAAPPPPPPPNP